MSSRAHGKPATPRQPQLKDGWLIDLDGRLALPASLVEEGETLHHAAQRVLGRCGFQVQMLRSTQRVRGER